MKILLLGLCYWTKTYMVETLNSLVKLDCEIDIVLLENQSPYSESIRRRFQRFSETWKGKFRHVLYDQNVAAEVYRIFYNDNKDLFDEYDYIFTTDMDVEINKKLWDDMCILAQTNLIVGAVCSEENFCKKVCPFDVSVITPIHANTFNGVSWGFAPVFGHTGNHLISFPVKYFKEFMETDYHVEDAMFGKFARERGLSWISPVNSRIYHLSWDGVLGMYGHEDIISYVKRPKLTNWNRQELAKSTNIVFDE